VRAAIAIGAALLALSALLQSAAFWGAAGVLWCVFGFALTFCGVLLLSRRTVLQDQRRKNLAGNPQLTGVLRGHAGFATFSPRSLLFSRRANQVGETVFEWSDVERLTLARKGPLGTVGIAAATLTSGRTEVFELSDVTRAAEVLEPLLGNRLAHSG